MRFSLRSEFARRLNLGNIPKNRKEPDPQPGCYRKSYAVCVTVAVTPLSVARPARREKNQKRAQQPSAYSHILFSFLL